MWTDTLMFSLSYFPNQGCALVNMTKPHPHLLLLLSYEKKSCLYILKMLYIFL